MKKHLPYNFYYEDIVGENPNESLQLFHCSLHSINCNPSPVVAAKMPVLNKEGKHSLNVDT